MSLVFLRSFLLQKLQQWTWPSAALVPWTCPRSQACTTSLIRPCTGSCSRYAFVHFKYVLSTFYNYLLLTGLLDIYIMIWHYDWSQYTQPNVGQIDLKPLLCPSCVPPLKTPLSFQLKMLETISLLSNRSVALAMNINYKTNAYSQKFRSLVRQGLERMELDKRMKKTARFILDRKEALAKEFDSSSLLNCIE